MCFKATIIILPTLSCSVMVYLLFQVYQSKWLTFFKTTFMALANPIDTNIKFLKGKLSIWLTYLKLRNKINMELASTVWSLDWATLTTQSPMQGCHRVWDWEELKAISQLKMHIIMWIWRHQHRQMLRTV